MKYFLKIMKPCTFFLLISLGSCGKENKNSLSIIQSQNQVSQGKYRAILRPVNNKLSGFLPLGYSEVQVDEEEFKVKIQMQDLAALPHPQLIHQGKRCPTYSDDKDNDGTINQEEAMRASGDSLLLLDDNLNPNEEDSQTFPAGKSYTYFEKTPLFELENHVLNKTGEKLNLHGRVIFIYGSEAGKMVPVSCGVLQREIPKNEE